MTSTLRKRVARVALATVVLAGVAGAAAYASDRLGTASDDASAPAHSQQPARSVASSVGEELTAAFSVLRRERGQDDALPPEESARIAAVAAAYGANPSLARRSRVVDGLSLYVVPGSEAVCLMAVGDDPLSGGGGGCTETAQALDGYLVQLALTRGGIRVTGLLPDGASSARVVLASGREAGATVVDNAYSIEVAESVESVRFELDGTKRIVPTPFEIVPLAREQDGKPVQVG